MNPPPTSHPISSLWIIPMHQPKHPVSCIEHRLALRFLHDGIHISMPFSQIIPPSPSPSEYKIRSIHLCLFCCLTYRVILTIFLNFIYMHSVQFIRSVVSDSLQPHESQHARPPCPSPTPGVHSDSCPSSQWCHPAISSCVVPFSSCPQSLPASKLFQWVNSSHEVAKILEF